jgi:hypothetical protein
LPAPSRRPTGAPGRDPSRALQLAQIAPERLIEVDGRMTARQMELLSGTAMQELDDEGLGAFSRRLPWGQLRHAGARLAQRPLTWVWRSSAGAATTAC